MTEPTPTRAEVEAFSPHVGWDAVPTMKLDADLGSWVRLSEYAALRERAEAAEAERAEQWRQRREAEAARDTALAISDAARRAEAAAWNDAIEAAAGVAEHERDHGGRDQDGEFVCSEEAAIWGGNCAEVIRHGIRALRRAAPTEGEA